MVRSRFRKRIFNSQRRALKFDKKHRSQKISKPLTFEMITKSLRLAFSSKKGQNFARDLAFRGFGTWRLSPLWRLQFVFLRSYRNLSKSKRLRRSTSRSLLRSSYRYRLKCLRTFLFGYFPSYFSRRHNFGFKKFNFHYYKLKHRFSYAPRFYRNFKRAKLRFRTSPSFRAKTFFLFKNRKKLYPYNRKRLRTQHKPKRPVFSYYTFGFKPRAFLLNPLRRPGRSLRRSFGYFRYLRRNILLRNYRDEARLSKRSKRRKRSITRRALVLRRRLRFIGKRFSTPPKSKFRKNIAFNKLAPSILSRYKRFVTRALKFITRSKFKKSIERAELKRFFIRRPWKPRSKEFSDMEQQQTRLFQFVINNPLYKSLAFYPYYSKKASSYRLYQPFSKTFVFSKAGRTPTLSPLYYGFRPNSSNYSFRRFPVFSFSRSVYSSYKYNRIFKKNMFSFRGLKRRRPFIFNRFKRFKIARKSVKKFKFYLGRRFKAYALKSKTSQGIYPSLFVRRRFFKLLPFLSVFYRYGRFRYKLRPRRKKFFKYFKKYFRFHKFRAYRATPAFRYLKRRLSRIRYYVHIFRSLNNFFVNVSAPRGRSLYIYSAGRTFYRGSRKLTPLALDLVGRNVGQKLKSTRINSVHVVFHSPIDYLSRALLKGLRLNVNFSGFSYYLSKPHNGLRKPATRRV